MSKRKGAFERWRVKRESYMGKGVPGVPRYAHEVVRRLRCASGITIAELAARLGCSVKHLHNLEDGERWPGRAMLVRQALAALDDGPLWDRFEANAAMALQLGKVPE